MKKQFNFEKLTNGLLPVIVQDYRSRIVLKFGFMNKEALELSIKGKLIAFFDTNKKQVFLEGEESANYLKIKSLLPDSSNQSLLILAEPLTISSSDFGQSNVVAFLDKLEEVIKDRKKNPIEDSRTSKLLARGIEQIAKKLGEESVELIIEALGKNNKSLFLNEAADLMFHYLVLLVAKGHDLKDVIEILAKRSK